MVEVTPENFLLEFPIISSMELFGIKMNSDRGGFIVY